MANKVLLILADGLRPDSIYPADPAFAEFFKSGIYSFQAQTTYPTSTTTCHMSLFHSVGPERHGTNSNIFVPFACPVKGLIENLNAAGKTTGFLFTWLPLRDIFTPRSGLDYGWFVKQTEENYTSLPFKVTDAAIQMIDEYAPDFVFLYLGSPDAYGHYVGWMTPEYISGVKDVWSCIQKVCKALPDEYSVIVTADHGGHDQTHGTDMPEDMLIPVVVKGNGLPVGRELSQCDIRDVAPTVMELMGLAPDSDWDGTSILKQIQD